MRLHATWLTLIIGISLTACQETGPTALEPQGPRPLAPAGPPCDKNPDHPDCDGEVDSSGPKADALVELTGGYSTPVGPMPVRLSLKKGANAMVSFLSAGDQSMKLDIPDYEDFAICDGSSDTDPDFTQQEQAAFWNAFEREAVERNYFAKVQLSDGANGSPHEEHRTHGGHITVDETGDEIRWIYRAGTSPLFPGLLATGTWDQAEETITISGGAIQLSAWNLTDGDFTRVACVNAGASAREFVSNRCDNENPAC